MLSTDSGHSLSQQDSHSTLQESGGSRRGAAAKTVPVVVNRSDQMSRSSAHDRYSDVNRSAAAFFRSMETIWSLASHSRASMIYGHANPQKRTQALSFISQDGDKLKAMRTEVLDIFRKLEDDLQGQQKAWAPIHALPEHILLRIFKFSEAARYSLHGLRHFQAARTILYISRTCRYWRQVALKSPKLWTTLNLPSFNAADASVYAKYSQELPVAVLMPRTKRAEWQTRNTAASAASQPQSSSSLVGTLSSTQVRLQFCEKILPKIGYFRYDYDSSSDMPTWLSTSEAPQLHAIQLTYHNGDTCDFLPSVLKLGKPKLAVVSLQRVFISWTSIAQSPALTKLEVRFSNRLDADGRPDQDADIFKVFESCAGLQDVFLQCYDPLRGIPDPLDSPIHLRKLRKLHLDFSIPDLSCILQSVAVPKDLEELHVIARVDRRPKKGGCVIKFPVDPQCLPNITLMTKLDVNIATHQIRGFSRKMRSRLGSDGHRDPTAPWHFYVEVTSASSKDRDALAGETIGATFNHLQKFYIMPQLKELIVKDSPELPSRLNIDDLILFLRHSPLLSTLCIHQCDPKLIDKMTTYWTYAAHPLCPALARIEVHNMKIRLSSLRAFCQSFFGADCELVTGEERVSWQFTQNEASKSTLLRHRRENRYLQLLIGQGVYVMSSEEECRIVDVSVVKKEEDVVMGSGSSPGSEICLSSDDDDFEVVPGRKKRLRYLRASDSE